MEELLVYAILLYEEIITEEVYENRLNEMFIEDCNNEILLHLEWENNFKNAISFIRTNVDYDNFNHKIFGKALMGLLKKYYSDCNDINLFGYKMYSLWESLPGNIQDIEPFWTLSYADDPLSWKDEMQSRELYEKAFNYYEE